ncbi:MAG: glycerol-3-phosphate dehydrogenase/oxidase, partial [Pseudomonadota bacterium]
MRRDIEALKSDQFDIVVVGAGIHGACAARDAALRGMKVALIDKGDLNGATSHNSLKTIHGGIRYLQHLDFKRSWQSIKEQKVWLRTAPHLTKPLPFIMPTYGHGMRGPLAMFCGVNLFNLLGIGRNRHLRKDRQLPAGKVVGRNTCLEKAPTTKPENLTGGATWYDAQIEQADQAVLQICQQTTELGGVVANYVRAGKIRLDGNQKIEQIELQDELTGEKFTIAARSVLNAAGPWAANYLQGLDSAAISHQGMALTKSMNLVVNRPAPEFAQAAQSKLVSDSKVGHTKRLYFMVPWQTHTMFGTTHFPFNGDLNNAGATDAEVKAFVDEINQAFPGYNLEINEVSYCYHGLTPAEEEDGGSSRARHSRIVVHDIHGLVSMISVKWTTARLVAKKAVDAIAKQLGISKPCTTDVVAIEDSFDLPNTFGELDESKLETLIEHHVEHTMCLTLVDLLTRRTDDLALNKLDADALIKIAKVMAKVMSWSNSEILSQFDRLSKIWLPIELRP